MFKTNKLSKKMEKAAKEQQQEKPVFEQEYFKNCHRTYSCIHCRAHLANHDELISKLFQGNHGRAYLFNKVVNIGCKQAVRRELLTGLHAVADIYCDGCKTTLGWKYEQAFVASQKYKEGKYIIELVHMLKENNWDLTSYNARELLEEVESPLLEETKKKKNVVLVNDGFKSIATTRSRYNLKNSYSTERTTVSSSSMQTLDINVVQDDGRPIKLLRDTTNLGGGGESDGLAAKPEVVVENALPAIWRPDASTQELSLDDRKAMMMKDEHDITSKEDIDNSSELSQLTPAINGGDQNNANSQFRQNLLNHSTLPKDPLCASQLNQQQELSSSFDGVRLDNYAAIGEKSSSNMEHGLD